MPTRAYKKVQYAYGYPGKNGHVSDQTEHTFCEIYSSKNLTSYQFFWVDLEISEQIQTFL